MNADTRRKDATSNRWWTLGRSRATLLARGRASVGGKDLRENPRLRRRRSRQVRHRLLASRFGDRPAACSSALRKTARIVVVIKSRNRAFRMVTLRFAGAPDWPIVTGSASTMSPQRRTDVPDFLRSTWRPPTMAGRSRFTTMRADDHQDPAFGDGRSTVWASPPRATDRQIRTSASSGTSWHRWPSQGLRLSRLRLSGVVRRSSAPEKQADRDQADG